MGFSRQEDWSGCRCLLWELSWSLVTEEPKWCQISAMNGASFTLEQWGLLSRPACRVRRVVDCRPGPSSAVLRPPSHTHRHLCCCLPGSVFGLGAGQLQDQQACGVQPNNHYKKKESYGRDIALCYWSSKWPTFRPKPEIMINKFLYFFQVTQVVVMKEMANLKHKWFSPLHQKCLTEKTKA